MVYNTSCLNSCLKMCSQSPDTVRIMSQIATLFVQHYNLLLGNEQVLI